MPWYTDSVMFLRRYWPIFVVFTAVLAILASTLAPYYSRAQETDIGARRAALQSQLDTIEGQIAQTQGVLTKLNGESQSIQRDINILDAGIKKSQLQIRATQVQIQALAENITVHASTIGTLTGRLSDERDSLAQIVRKTREVNDFSLVELVFSSEDLSSFFGDLDSFAVLKQQLGESSKELTRTKAQTETEKSQLEDQKIETERLKSIQAAEQQKIKNQQDQKKALLAQTKSQQATYQSIIAAQQKTAAQIRAELFALAGGNGAITLPIAITLAKQAGAATGVRPALILAILKQETDLGKNVGQCLLTNSPAKGDGKGKNTGTPFAGVMKPTRDVDPFLAITAKLGLDPYSQPVSCPPSYGYGGAMGPAQFIPSTWVIYESRVAQLAGHPSTPASPWNNLDAFTATALLMADNGATAQTPAAERLAAQRYFAGWGNASNPAYSFYGDGVMGFASQFQSDIDTLGG
ncbi:MAG: hypothetical protein AB202_01565 [Parcubacteria bacterium C7867-007]|nr:MAG: hypothetical protein AB202_01565 [Parcubacteria bacterium C7867-007]